MTNISAWLSLKHLSDCLCSGVIAARRKRCLKSSLSYGREERRWNIYPKAVRSAPAEIFRKSEQIERVGVGITGDARGEICRRRMICLIAEKVERVCITHYFLLTEVLPAERMFGGRRQAFPNLCLRPGRLDWITRDRQTCGPSTSPDSDECEWWREIEARQRMGDWVCEMTDQNTV